MLTRIRGKRDQAPEREPLLQLSENQEPLPKIMNFTSKQSNEKVAEWLCLDQFTSQELVRACFQTSNT